MRADRIEALEELLAETEAAHGAYESAELHGVYDEQWPRWYAEYAVGHGIGAILGYTVTADELSRILASSWDELHDLQPKPVEPWGSYAARKLAEMTPRDAAFGEVASSALEIPGIVSAAIFVERTVRDGLRLAAAAGIDGEPLRRLSTAVLDPGHPIARTFRDGTPSFDVPPTAPGGPALRSHAPIVVQRDGQASCLGVLAVAHDRPLDAAARDRLTRLADRAARVRA